VGRHCRKHICLPELEEGDVVPVDGKPNVFSLNLKSEPDLLINGELDLPATHGHVSTIAARLLSDAINHHQLKDTRFAAIPIEANLDWQNTNKSSELSKIMDRCVKEALTETILLWLRRIKNLSASLSDDFTCIVLLHMEENGLLEVPRAEIARAYVREMARACKAEMNLPRLVRNREFTKVWRQTVYPVFEQARRDFRTLRGERNRLKNELRYVDFKTAWTNLKARYNEYGLLLDRVGTSAPTDLAKEYIQIFFNCDADVEAIYEQMKIAKREQEQASASPSELAISNALDQLT